MKKVLLTSALLIFVLFQGYAQRFDYEKTSKIFFGLNVGSVWHTSDVENAKDRFPLGAGFVFGRSINQNYGNAVSFDLRFRYLGGAWYGKDSDTTSAIQNNNAVQPLYDTLGYTVQNFRAAQHRFALELSIHANRFKERTGIDPYIFGGIGFTVSNIRGDLLQSINDTDQYETYPYDQTQNGSINDEKYETAIDKNEAGDSYEPNDFNVKVLPSLGIGIGYYFNSRFSMGIEHKTTFVMDDYFDGTTLNQNGRPSELFENDLYHYTSIYFKWYLRGSKNTYTHPRDNKPDPQPQNPGLEPIRRDKPIVDFSNPQNTPHKTNAPTFDLRANVRNVSSADWITFTQNQNRSTSFNFNPQTQVFQANVRLIPGLNIFFLKGENQFGKSRDVVEIYYEIEEREKPPIVKITNPNVSPFIVNQLTYNLNADIRSVKARNQIIVTFNGQNVNNFSFNKTGSNNFSIPLNLRGGTNTLRIEARNNFGVDNDEAVFIYKREDIGNKGFPPTVNILIPTADPYTTNQLNESIVANVENINNKQNIAVRINGIQTSNFTFNLGTGQVQLNAGLIAGVNTIRVSASNNFGNAFDETTIIYKRAQVSNPPTVQIITPNENPFTTNQLNENIVANTSFVTTKQQVEVRINGIQTSNFTFNSGTVQLNAGLNVGVNTIRVSVNNNYGNAFDETTIIYKRAEVSNPPTVQIITPNENPFTTNQLNENIVANTNFVTTKQQVEVLINGIQTNNFVLDVATSNVHFTAALNSGTNTVLVKATNNYGNAFDERIIIYSRKPEIKLPFVTFISPIVGQSSVELAKFKMIARVENVKSKNNVEVFFNGNLVNSSEYNFNTQFQTINYLSSLKIGFNTFIVKVRNDDGNHQASIKIERKRVEVGNVDQEKPEDIEIVPCKLPKVRATAPSNQITKLTKNEYVVRGFIDNITKYEQIEVFLNGVRIDGYIFNTATRSFTNRLKFIKANNTYIIKLTNGCGITERKFTFIYDRVDNCGVNFEIINSSSEFCLVTSKGTVLGSQLLSNSNFDYKGNATSLYFKANKTGSALVNGKLFNLISGNYYHFVGTFKVDLSKRKAGSIGKWNVCVESARMPIFGKGTSKPNNPCAKPEIKKPVVTPKPNLRNGPDNKKPKTISKPNTIQKPAMKRRGVKRGEEQKKSD